MWEVGSGMASCCGMIMSQAHDPFFYGSLLQSIYTIIACRKRVPDEK